MTAMSSRREMERQQPPKVGRMPLDKLSFHRRNIRTDLGDLRELTASIAADGVLQALLAHKRGNALELLDGHRRLAAARLAGLKTVPVQVIDERTDDEAITTMLATGLMKSDLTATDKRLAVRELIDVYDYKVSTIARQFGVTTQTVRNWLAEPAGAEKPARPRGSAGRRNLPVPQTKIRRLLDDWSAIPTDRGLSQAETAELLHQLRTLIEPTDTEETPDA